MSNRKLFILFIALSNYHPATGVPSLPGVQGDSERLRETFLDYADVPIHRLYWLPNQLASKQAIIDKLQVIAKEASTTDQIVVYFGGHGERAWNPISECEQYYLLPYDATFASAATKGISTDELGTALNTLHVQELVVILDCCYSGGMTQLDWTNDLREELQAGWRSYYAMAAARGREQAGEVDWGGFFIQALCDALQGKGVIPDVDGRISAQKAWSYAAEKAKEMAEGYGHQQVSVSSGIGIPIYLTRPKQDNKPVPRLKVPTNIQIPDTTPHLEYAGPALRLYQENKALWNPMPVTEHDFLLAWKYCDWYRDEAWVYLKANGMQGYSLYIHEVIELEWYIMHKFNPFNRHIENDVDEERYGRAHSLALLEEHRYLQNMARVEGHNFSLRELICCNPVANGAEVDWSCVQEYRGEGLDLADWAYRNDLAKVYDWYKSKGFEGV